MRPLVLVVLVLAILPARADEAPALARVRTALAAARHDLEGEHARTETARSEAARVTSEARARRDASLARLEEARRSRRDLAAREAAARSETERLGAESDALENDLGPARDLCRRLAERERIADAPNLGAIASAVLAALAEDAELHATMIDDQVDLGGRRVKGRVLALGPGAWFLGADGVEAIARADRSSYVACPGEGIAGAFAAFDRGERSLELPLDPLGEAAGATSFVRRSAELLRQGGLAILPLLALSVLSLMVVVERLVAGRRIVAAARAAVESFALARRTGELGPARGSVERALRRGLEGDRAAAAESVRAAVLGELRARLWLLGSVGASAPFVGLFGTVVGIVRAFESIAKSGAAGFNVVAGGIAEALVATAAGIVVAVFAVLAYNALGALAASRAARIAARVEEVLDAR